MIENAKYEEDIEDPRTVQARRNKLPKSVVDDRFFSLAEMEAFLETQDRAEEAKLKMGRNLGQFEMAEEMEQLIGEYERENLKTRGWALQGEAVAEERGKDELLEQFVDVDYRTVAAPTVTEAKTAQLESIIRKRIKEKLFDDVERKFRDSEALVPSYRNEATIELSVRKSLAEVYEDKFTAELNKAEEASTQQQLKPTLDPKVKAIQRDMDALFMQLDALSHNQFRPQLIQEEVKIVNNMPSLRLEEVGPTASAAPTANLLAPEEVMRRVKSAPKAQEERTDTDRKRERRHKKRKQHVLASIGAMDGDDGSSSRTDKSAIDSAGGTTSEEPGSRKRRFKGGAGNRKLDFAGGMQALIGSANAEAAGSSSGRTQQPWKRKRV